MGQTNLCNIGPLHAAQTGFSCLGVVLLIVEWIHWFVELTSGLHRARGAKSTLLQPMQGVSLTVITSLCCTLKCLCFHGQFCGSELFWCCREFGGRQQRETLLHMLLCNSHVIHHFAIVAQSIVGTM